MEGHLGRGSRHAQRASALWLGVGQAHVEERAEAGPGQCAHGSVGQGLKADAGLKNLASGMKVDKGWRGSWRQNHRREKLVRKQWVPEQEGLHAGHQRRAEEPAKRTCWVWGLCLG